MLINGNILDYAINNKLTPFISMQNHYSLVYREEEREMMPTLKVSFEEHHSAKRRSYRLAGSRVTELLPIS
jgi:hypothetical protein